MEDSAYYIWKRDVKMAYTIVTGRLLPKIGTKARGLYFEKLIHLSDLQEPPSPEKAIEILISEGILRPR